MTRVKTEEVQAKGEKLGLDQADTKGIGGGTVSL